MSFNTGKLRKLRAMSLDELIGRSQQEFAKRVDRLFVAAHTEMSDEALYREFLPASRNGSGQGTVEILLDRLREGENLFLPGLAHRKAIVKMMEERFGSERAGILRTAEKAQQGCFDLLGYTDLNFNNPIEWHKDPLTGAQAPLTHWSRIDSVAPLGEGDLKVFWEIQRTQHFVTLGQAYWLTGESRFAAEFVRQANSWISANPVGLGMGWSASLDVAFRAISWIWALHLCADSNEVTPAFLTRALKSLIEHGSHIEKYLSYYFSPNTHLTGEALGLFYLGTAFPELKRADKWRKLGMQILIEQLDTHVRKDGVYFEHASYYHRYTTDFYAHLFVMIRAAGLSLPREDEQHLWNKLDALLSHLIWIMRPDATWPFFGDDDGGRLIKLSPREANDFRDTVALGASILKRGDLKYCAGQAPAELLWLLGPESIHRYDELPAQPPADLSRAFETGGYFVMRDGWEETSSFCLIDCGRHGSELGPGHAHADALSVEIALQGTSWIVDPGTFVYGVSPEIRNWFRSTAGHNTAIVDDQDQSVPGAPFAWNSIAECSTEEFSDRREIVTFSGSHNGYHRLNDPVTHSRSLLFLRKKGALIIADKFHANVRHEYTLVFHLVPECDAMVIDRYIVATHSNGEKLYLHTFVKGQGLNVLRARVEEGWVSTCYGKRARAPIAVFDASGDGPVEFTTVILATRPEQKSGSKDDG